MKQGIIIAIDGPVASGKGTIAPMLAETLKGFYLHTGAMYRCVALYSLEHSLTTDTDIIQALPDIHINFSNDKTFLNDEDVTEKIHQNIVSSRVAWVATIKEIRNLLIGQQQRIGREKIQSGITVVAEGRDTGTVVFPNAEVKLFLDASVETRAQRRLAQLEKRGERITFEQVLDDTIKRDQSDQQKSGALVTDPISHGYDIIETTGLTQEETLEKILSLLREKNIV